jgi:hypothetical protein
MSGGSYKRRPTVLKLYRYDPQSMDFTPMYVWRYVVLFICLLFLMSISRSTYQPSDQETELSIFGVHSGEMEFTPENLMLQIKRSGVRFPEIVFAQAVIETGHFKSTIFMEGNNLFGMKVARSRPTTSIGEYSNHALYDHWTSSVMDYALYQSAYLRKLKTKDQYYNYLSQNYAEDPNYVTKLKRYESNN